MMYCTTIHADWSQILALPKKMMILNNYGTKNETERLPTHIKIQGITFLFSWIVYEINTHYNRRNNTFCTLLHLPWKLRRIPDKDPPCGDQNGVSECI